LAKIYKDIGYKLESLNSKIIKKKKTKYRFTLILKEIRKSRIEICFNISKIKIKKNLDYFVETITH